MNELATSLLLALNRPDIQQSAHTLLTQTISLFCQHLQADVVVGYELIPETGGIPRLPPLYAGELFEADEAAATMTHSPSTSALADFIRYGQPYYEADAQGWSAVRRGTGQMDYPQFVATEKIRSFVVLPVRHTYQKMALLLLNFRGQKVFSQADKQVLEACTNLVGIYLAQFQQASKAIQGPQNQMAIAHTLYGSVAVVFKGQVDALEAEITKAFGQAVPPALFSYLETTKNIVFEGMRNLVIDAASEMLVDLKMMPLSKALNTTVAALRRAWPPGQAVTIDLEPIPAVIEHQSLKLRQLLYTLILEVIGNSIKHGGPAPYINIGLRWANNRIYIQIIDHGKGFDLLSHPFSEYGLGFWHIYITRYLTGTFEVSSQPGYGTVVNATIPVIPVRRS